MFLSTKGKIITSLEVEFGISWKASANISVIFSLQLLGKKGKAIITSLRQHNSSSPEFEETGTSFGVN